MQICSRCNTQAPDMATHCPNCTADLSEWSNTAVALKRLKSNPRVSFVLVSVAHDCCPACQKAQGAYTKDLVPRLPIEGCSHSLGCRCYYQPVLEEIFP